MDFQEVDKRLSENKELLGRLKDKGVNDLDIKKVENVIVRDMLVFMYTSYQDNVRDAIIVRVKRHSNNSKEIVSFVRLRTKKINLKVDDLEKLLELFNRAYSSKFKQLCSSDEEVKLYSNIIEGRINVAHYQGNNLQIGSLNEVETAHDRARHLLEKFESSMW